MFFNIFLFCLKGYSETLIKSYHLHVAAVKSSYKRYDFPRRFEISNRFEFTSGLMQTCSKEVPGLTLHKRSTLRGTVLQIQLTNRFVCFLLVGLLRVYWDLIGQRFCGNFFKDGSYTEKNMNNVPIWQDHRTDYKYVEK